MKGFLKEKLSPSGANEKTFETAMVNSIGRELYEAFFKGYARKLWGINQGSLLQ